jgi:methionyl-tRNA synthetase
MKKKKKLIREIAGNMEKIKIDDFAKVEIKLGTVIAVEIVEGADKLYKLTVDLGEESPRQILSGIREFVSVEDMLGKQFPFVTNLEPRTIRGLESNGMMLAANDDERFALFNPTTNLKNGTQLR